MLHNCRSASRATTHRDIFATFSKVLFRKRPFFNWSICDSGFTREASSESSPWTKSNKRPVVTGTTVVVLGRGGNDGIKKSSIYPGTRSLIQSGRRRRVLLRGSKAFANCLLPPTPSSHPASSLPITSMTEARVIRLYGRLKASTSLLQTYSYATSFYACVYSQRASMYNARERCAFSLQVDVLILSRRLVC